MIGVNNLNALTRTLVRRRSVEYDDAKEIFERLISGRSGTVDPAIYQDGEIYEFDKDDPTESRRFYEDNSPNNEKPIYLISITKNCKESLVFANRVAYDGLKNNDKNPLFGRWLDEKREEWNDTCYVEVTIDHARALELKADFTQDKILVIRYNGRWEEI